MNKLLRSLAIALLGCILAIAFNFPHTQLFAQNSPNISAIERGIELYTREEYRSALNVWNSSINSEQDPLTKSFILNNMALAHGELGDRLKAENAISRSLQILERVEDKTPTATEIQAKAFNAQGYFQWLQGDFNNAITAWDSAIANYLQVGDREKAIESRLNRAKALQAAGFSSQARASLEKIATELAATENLPLRATGLQYLGNVLRKVGNLERSRDILLASLNLVETSDTLLELGNTEKALSDSYLETDREKLAKQYAKKAIFHYQLAFTGDNNLQAGLNQLSFAMALGQWSEIELLLPKLAKDIARLPDTKAGIDAKLNFARSLSCLQEIEAGKPACVGRLRQDDLDLSVAPSISLPSWQEIAQNIETISQNATNPQSKSYALGELGKIYESQGKWLLAKQYTQQALLALEGIAAPEISYRWQWQLGRILKQEENISQAITAYSQAIADLKLVRNDLLVVNTEAQFSFRDNTEPIYRDLVDLLLVGEVSQENLETAIQSIDTLQLTEVENFLNCDLGSTLQAQLTDRSLDDAGTNAGFIYPIILEDRLEVIFKLPGQPLRHHTNAVDKGTVEQTIGELQRSIIRGYPERIISSSTVAYDWLIAPIESYLQDSPETNTLVFVLDGELRNIPMGVLYDSKKQEYLIQKPYALALLPSFQIFDLQAKPQDLKVLGAGISEQLQVEDKSFVGLDVTEELNNIENTAPSSILLNSQFTRPNIQQNLEREDFSVVHLATHGNFSSNPEDTYLLVYDTDGDKGSLLKARDLDKLLRQQRTKQPLDLLVLSACETAEGDNRATLGLAGLAIEAGARSTLATLWQVSDRSTIELMTQFYQELQNPNTTKAMALHRAQQSLLKDTKYKSPFYWSPYVLVGNWQ